MHTLSETSALVMMWIGRDFYKSDACRKYCSALDLSSGRDLYDRLDKIWPYLSEEVKNRKFVILKQVSKILGECPELQLVCMGAGYDPLSLEICATHPEVRAFDVDREKMDEKSEIIRSVDPSLAKRIQCVQSDAGAPDLALKLSAKGWLASVPTIVVIEGISYYISGDDLRTLLSCFETADQRNHVVWEFLKPAELTDEPVRTYSERAWQVVIDDYNLPPLTRYTREDVRSIVGDRSGRVVDFFTIHDAERERTGVSRYFATENAGWVDLCLVKI